MNFYGEVLSNSARDFFVPLQGEEKYCTEGFKEIALIYGATEESYRKTSCLLNRIRHQEVGGTPSRTIREISEREGSLIESHLEAQSIKIFRESGFTPLGVPESSTLELLCDILPTMEEGSANEACTFLDESTTESAEISVEGIVSEAVNAVVLKHGLCDADRKEMLKNPVPYEAGDETVNISVDDVGAKQQKETRQAAHSQSAAGKKKRVYVQNTVIHVEQGGRSYVLNGYGVLYVLRLLLAFLLNNGLLTSVWVFFVDGHSFYSSVLQMFSWHPKVSVVLDWYHLRKKCGELLSMASKGSKIRNAVLGKLMPLLWYGLVDQAINYLKHLPEDQIKNQDELKHLMAYLDKNRVMIPVYAVRRELGLRNSSNRGEKANDVLVATRQKHHGMSWSKSGSVALASMTAIKKNRTYKMWFQERQIEFKFAS